MLDTLAGVGLPINLDTLRRLSPYLTGHVNRFGEHRLNLNRNTAPVDYQLPIIAR